MGLLSRAPERERETERERPPPRDLLKEARERREAARKEAERAAREKREADARQPPARHAPAPREPVRRPDDRERHVQQDRCACAKHAAYATTALRQEPFLLGTPLPSVPSLTDANRGPDSEQDPLGDLALLLLWPGELLICFCTSVSSKRCLLLCRREHPRSQEMPLAGREAPVVHTDRLIAEIAAPG